MVSIIIPAYNAEDYVDRCIESCLSQSYKDIEIIVVDDGSKDQTVNICKKYSDSRLKVIEKSNEGVSCTRNVGLSHAKGDLILFLDADDFLYEDCCARVVSEMTSDIDLMVFGYNSVTKNGIESTSCPDRKYIYNKDNICDCLVQLKSMNCLFTCWNKVYRKEKINVLFDEQMTFAEDSVFVLNYFLKCKTVLICPYIGYGYYIQTNNSAMKRFHENMLEMINKEFYEFERIDKDSIELLKAAITHYIENLFYWCIPLLIADKSRPFFKKIELLHEIEKINEIHKKVDYYLPKSKSHKLYIWLIKHRLYGLLYMSFYILTKKAA